MDDNGLVSLVVMAASPSSDISYGTPVPTPLVFPTRNASYGGKVDTGKTTAAVEPSQQRELLFEDDEIRVWRLAVSPGAQLVPPADDAADPQDHVLCVLKGGRALVSGTGSSSIFELNYTRGQTAFLRHGHDEQRGLLNRGETEMRFLWVELKR
jgi:hypothetical protein